MSDSGARRLTVIEYKGSQLIEEWDSLTECAKHHGCKQATIKELIHYGDSRRGHTFDIPTDSPYDTRENKTTGALEIFNTETGLVLDGGASKRGDYGDADISGLRRGSQSLEIAEGTQQGLQRGRAAKRNQDDQDLQAVGL
jgi:hypothetical protein